MKNAIITTLLQQHAGSGKRSDALKPLAWLFGLLVVCLLGLAFNDAHVTIQLVVLCGGGFVGALYVISYVYLLFADRDALRSEHFVIQKLAIEKGVYGDDINGIVMENNSSEILENGSRNAPNKTSNDALDDEA